MSNAKFIIVQDAVTANQLMSAGFKVASHINNTYIFINVAPQHFNFENIDIKKLVYTDRLSL